MEDPVTGVNEYGMIVGKHNLRKFLGIHAKTRKTISETYYYRLKKKWLGPLMRYTISGRPYILQAEFENFIRLRQEKMTYARHLKNNVTK